MNNGEWLSRSFPERHSWSSFLFSPLFTHGGRDLGIIRRKGASNRNKNTIISLFFSHLNSLRKIQLADFYEIMLKTEHNNVFLQITK